MMIKEKLVDGISIGILEKRFAKDFLDLVDSNRRFYEDYIPFVSRCRDVESLGGLLWDFMKRYADGTGCLYGLWDKDKLIGMVLYKDINFKSLNGEIGFMIDENYTRKGIVLAACKMMLDFMFGELGLNKAIIQCNSNNLASIGVAKKLGFVLEGTLRVNSCINSKLVDTSYFGLLKSEYKREKV